jgi:hypothetical protein
MLGNIDPNGLPALIDELSRLSAEGATVIWPTTGSTPRRPGRFARCSTTAAAQAGAAELD